MNSVKGFALVACLAMPLSTIVAVSSAPAETATAATKVAMSDSDKAAKAADCSKQADEKKLHGAARKKFRAECKKK